MDVVGVMAAYLPVLRVCTAQSRQAESVCTAQSREAESVCTAQSREAEIVCTAQSREAESVCTAQSREIKCVFDFLHNFCLKHFSYSAGYGYKCT